MRLSQNPFSGSKKRRKCRSAQACCVLCLLYLLVMPAYSMSFKHGDISSDFMPLAIMENQTIDLFATIEMEFEDGESDYNGDMTFNYKWFVDNHQITIGNCSGYSIRLSSEEGGPLQEIGNHLVQCYAVARFKGESGKETIDITSPDFLVASVNVVTFEVVIEDIFENLEAAIINLIDTLFIRLSQYSELILYLMLKLL